MTSSGPDGPPGRILVVEDDLVTGRFLTHLLGVRGGFEVTHTPDPAVALKRASSEPWDLVLTDVEMPGMTGLELLQAAMSPGQPGGPALGPATQPGAGPTVPDVGGGQPGGAGQQAVGDE